MYHQVGSEFPRRAVVRGMDGESTGAFVDLLDARVEMHGNPQLACRGNEAIDHIRIKVLQRTRATMKYRYICTGSRCDMREFERDVAAANEQNARRKNV